MQGELYNKSLRYHDKEYSRIEAIHETLQSLIGDDKNLIVFVDDLDRCSINNTLNILESIKLVFNVKNTIFIVGADMKMLETAWALKHKPQIESPHEVRLLGQVS